MAITKKIKPKRRYCGISYLPLQDFLLIMRKKANIIRNYAVIYHDMDLNEDGKFKEPHLHFIILFNYAYKYSTVCNWFNGFVDEEGLTINTNIQDCSDIHSYYMYFTHEGHPEKFQYDANQIIALNHEEFKIEDISCEDSCFIALDLLLNGTPTYEVCKRMGRDFILHYSSYVALVEQINHEIYYEEIRKNKRECEERFAQKKINN